MRYVAKRRFPVILIILFALVGIALSVAIGRVISAGTRETAAIWGWPQVGFQQREGKSSTWGGQPLGDECDRLRQSQLLAGAVGARRTVPVT